MSKKRTVLRQAQHERAFMGASAPIIGVDADIAVGQVARPNGGAAFAQPEIGAAADFEALEVRRDRRLVIAIDRSPVLRHPLIAQTERGAVAVSGVDRPPTPHNPPAPRRTSTV